MVVDLTLLPEETRVLIAYLGNGRAVDPENIIYNDVVGSLPDTIVVDATEENPVIVRARKVGMYPYEVIGTSDIMPVGLVDK